MINRNKQIEQIFQAKKKYRNRLAKLPVEEKVGLLIKMQKMANPILRARGQEWKPWMTSEIFQVKYQDTINPQKSFHVHSVKHFPHLPTVKKLGVSINDIGFSKGKDLP